MEATNTVDMQAETLSGDVRDQFLDVVRMMDEGWTKLSEHQQKRIISNVDTLARKVVRGSVDIVAHTGFPHVAIAVQDIGLADGIKIKATAAFTVEDVTKLAAHGRGKPAVLVLADPATFFGEREEALADKDQPDLPIHDEDGVIEGETKLELNELRSGDDSEGEGDEAAAENELPEADELPDAPEPESPPRRRTRARADA